MESAGNLDIFRFFRALLSFLDGQDLLRLLDLLLESAAQLELIIVLPLTTFLLLVERQLRGKRGVEGGGKRLEGVLRKLVTEIKETRDKRQETGDEARERTQR